MKKIIETTDNKYLGLTIEDKIILDGVEFIPTLIQDLGNGLIRYSTSNYIILTKEIK